MTLLERNPVFAEAFNEQVEKLEKLADTLSWITQDKHPLYLNINTCGKARVVEPFTGEDAAWLAYEDAKANGAEHLTTLVLRSDGTWSEQHLLPL